MKSIKLCLSLGLCEVYVNESIFCDICKNGSNFLFIDFIVIFFVLNVIFWCEFI